jgi:hypothetical protein
MCAAMPVTAMPFGAPYRVLLAQTIDQLNRVRRSFIVSILAGLSISMSNYSYSASASALSWKLRSLSLRAVLRQDSKSISYFGNAKGIPL